jgi:hypothetical protein
MTCRPWSHNLRIRLDRRPFVWQCSKCLNCWNEIDRDFRPVGEPYPVDPTVPIQAAVSEEGQRKKAIEPDPSYRPQRNSQNSPSHPAIAPRGSIRVP